MRVVVDSNVWISALVFGGNPRRVFERIVKEGYTLIVSEEIITETRRILTAKFGDFADDFEDLILALQLRLVYVRLGAVQVQASRDPDDNVVLETAILGEAAYIISGDKDLLVLGQLKDICIVTPSNFMSLKP